MECSTFVEKMQVPSAGEAVEVRSVYTTLLRVMDRCWKRGNGIQGGVDADVAGETGGGEDGEQKAPHFFVLDPPQFLVADAVVVDVS